ncbi:hypothetical protein ACHAW5_005705 [Stephanodiscus triporus]|uniref:Uncharacterized protein n=1 Tax=Stephanodiscus triporus TaxID=2934178 RepID=A0ABD3NLU5_9STRA
MSPAAASTPGSPSGNNYRHAYPAVISATSAYSSATGPEVSRGGGGCDRDEEFEAEESPPDRDGSCSFREGGRGGAKVAAIRLSPAIAGVSRQAMPPRGGRELAEEGGRTPARSSPYRAGDLVAGHPGHRERERDGGCLDESRVGKCMVMHHRDVPPNRIHGHDIPPSNQQFVPSPGGEELLDERSCRNVEASHARVMRFLKNVRRLASLEGGTPSSLDVVITLSGEGGSGCHGALRSVLRMTFLERNVRFIDHVGSIQVDALSGMWDDDDNDNIRRPSNYIHCHRHEPNPEDPKGRGRAGGLDWIPSKSDVLLRSYRREEESTTMESSASNNPSTGTFANPRQSYPQSPRSNRIYDNLRATMAPQDRLSQGISAAHDDIASQLHERLATQKRPSQYTVAAHNDSVSQLRHVRDCPPLLSTDDTTNPASSQRLRQQQTYLQHVPLPLIHATSLHSPPVSTTIATAKQAFPKDQGSMMFMYNPFDPIEHALQPNTKSTAMSTLLLNKSNASSLARGRNSTIKLDISDPYLNKASGAYHNSDTAAGEITSTHSHHRHRDAGVSSSGGPTNVQGVEDNSALGFAPSRMLETPQLLHIQKRVRSPSSSSPPRHRDDIHIVPSSSLRVTSTASLPERQVDESRRSRQSCNTSEIRRAISESQATHIAHTRQQVADDIEFRRSLERASNESARNLVGESADVDEREVLSARDKYEAELELALRQSEHAHELRREEEERIRASEEELIADLLVRTRMEEERVRALRQEEDERIRASEEQLIADLLVRTRVEEERVHALRQEEEERIRASEEQLIADLLVRTRVEEEGARQQEEEMLRKALAASLEDHANVDENGSVAEAVKKSVQDCDVDPIERVLQLSLDEKEMLDEEEEELIRRAMEQSVLDIARW